MWVRVRVCGIDMFATVSFWFQVENLLLIVMQSAHLVAQRKAFQQSMEDVLTLSREQTSSQPLIASALEDLKVVHNFCVAAKTAVYQHPTFISLFFLCSCCDLPQISILCQYNGTASSSLTQAYL